jgi:hypothetical protein
MLIKGALTETGGQQYEVNPKGITTARRAAAAR